MRLSIGLICFVLLVQSCGNQREKQAYQFFLKANAATRQRDEREAIRLYTEAIEKKPDWPDAYYNRGLCYRKLGRVQEARTDFQQALQLDPEFGIARYSLAKLLADSDKWSESLQELKRFPAAYQDSTYVLIGLANANSQLGNYAMALAEYNQALSQTEKIPERIEIFVNRGSLFYMQKQAGAAESDFRQALKLNQNEDFALNNLSLIEAKKNRFQEALILIERAISLRPGQSTYLNNRGYILLALNRLPEAKATIESALRLDDTNAWGWRNLGIYYFKVNQSADALRELRKAEKIDPSVERLYYYLGEVNRKDGRLSDACDAYRMGERLNDSDAVAARKLHCFP